MSSTDGVGQPRNWRIAERMSSSELAWQSSSTSYRLSLLLSLRSEVKQVVLLEAELERPFLSQWLLPMVLLSNTVGGFTSRRTCLDTMRRFIYEATEHGGGNNGDQNGV